MLIFFACCFLFCKLKLRWRILQDGVSGKQKGEGQNRAHGRVPVKLPLPVTPQPRKNVEDGAAAIY